MHIPTDMDQIVVGVLGLDNRPQASPHLRHYRTKAEGADLSYTPPQLAQLYNYQNYAQFSGANALQDITDGNNGAYDAGPGWDACTGLGSPNGANLLKALSAIVSSAVPAIASSTGLPEETFALSDGTGVI